MKEKIIKCIDHALEREHEEIIEEFAAEGKCADSVWNNSWEIAAQRIEDEGFAKFNEDYDICDPEILEEYALAEKIFEQEIKKHL